MFSRFPCVSVLVHRRYVLVHRADLVMCLLAGEGGGGEGNTHTHTASWDVLHRACQLLSLSPQHTPSCRCCIPHSLAPTPPPHTTSRQKQRAAAAASKGTAAPPMFNLCSGFSFPLFFLLLLLPDSPSSKHFWLFCFAALQRVIAHDNDHGRLFSLRSPGLCMHAGASITL